MKKGLKFIVIILSLILFSIPVAAQEVYYIYRSIDYQDNVNGDTILTGINDDDKIIGYYCDDHYECYGPNEPSNFMFDLATESFSDILSPPLTKIKVEGINNLFYPNIVGGATNEDCIGCAFILDGDTNIFTALPFPRAADANGINDKDIIVGNTEVLIPGGGQKISAFIYDFTNGASYYDHEASYPYPQTYFSDVNNDDTIVGFYPFLGPNNNVQLNSFIFKNNIYSDFVYPGASITRARGINDANQIVGEYVFDGGHGFLLSGLSFSPIDFPGAYRTMATGINNAGRIVGYYWDNTYLHKIHGFIATPVWPRMIGPVLGFFDKAVSAGTLIGIGGGKSGSNKLNTLRNMIEVSGNLIEKKSITGACQKLMEVYKKTDGNPSPQDFVSGAAAPGLARLIKNLRTDLQCK